MAVAAPGWLTKHNGSLSLGSDGRTWFVNLGDEPQYRLVEVPATGKFTCDVTQTINGRRLDKGGVFASRDEAIQGGLEDLREALGW
jgi:hypothetical protein